MSSNLTPDQPSDPRRRESRNDDAGSPEHSSNKHKETGAKEGLSPAHTNESSQQEPPQGAHPEFAPIDEAKLRISLYDVQLPSGFEINIRIEQSQPAVLLDWQIQVLAERASLFVSSITTTLEEAGELILHPCDDQEFLSAQETRNESYESLRDEYRTIFFALTDARTNCLKCLTPDLYGTGKELNAGKLQIIFEECVIPQMTELADLCKRAHELHKEAFLEELDSQNDDSAIASDSANDTGNTLDRKEDQEEAVKKLFNEWDKRLVRVLGICALHSGYLNEQDEAKVHFILTEFLKEKASTFDLALPDEATGIVTAQPKNFALLLTLAGSILGRINDLAIQEALLTNPQQKKIPEILKAAQELQLQSVPLTLESSTLSQNYGAVHFYTIEMKLPEAAALSPNRASGFKQASESLKALQEFAKSQNIGMVTSADNHRILFYIFESVPSGQITQFNSMYENSEDPAVAISEEPQATKVDTRSLDHDFVISKGKSNFFLHAPFAAFASPVARRSVSNSISFFAECVALESKLTEIDLLASAPVGQAYAEELQKRFEAGDYRMILSSAPEYSPNFELNVPHHPLNRPLQNDADKERAESPVAYCWQPSLGNYRDHRYLNIETVASGIPEIQRAVLKILAQAHPLHLGITIPNILGADDSVGKVVLEHGLIELSTILAQLREKHQCGKLYIAQIEPEQSAPGYTDIRQVYNVYDPKGFLISRIYAKQHTKPEPKFEYVARDIRGKELLSVEKIISDLVNECPDDHRYTVSDLKQYFEERNIFCCDTLLQEICSHSQEPEIDDATEAIIKFFRGPSVWIERELETESKKSRLYIFSQREREYR